MDIDLTPLKTFAASRPVRYGAPLAAVIGVALGLVFQVGSQSEPSVEMAASGPAGYEEAAQPISWPSGKVPDYVIGTDFLQQTKPQAYAAFHADDWREPAPVHAEPAEQAETAAPIVIAARPAREETRWASTQGDILDVRLPEDEPVETPLLN